MAMRILLFFILNLFFITAHAQNSSSSPGKKEKVAYSKKMNGDILKELNLVDINGKEYTLEDLDDKVIVLHFWFTKCKPCIAEIPTLNKLENEFKDKPVVFFAITFDDTETLNHFFKNREFNYHIIPYERRTIDKFEVPYYPYNILIHKDRKIEYLNEIDFYNKYRKMKKKLKKML